MTVLRVFKSRGGRITIPIKESSIGQAPRTKLGRETFGTLFKLEDGYFSRLLIKLLSGGSISKLLMKDQCSQDWKRDGK